MRLVVVCVFLSLASGCKRAAEKAPPPSAVTPNGATAPGGDRVQGPGRVMNLPTRPSLTPVPMVQAPPGIRSVEEAPAPRIDCERLLGADKASALLGQKVTIALTPASSTPRCKWAKGAGDDSALVDVSVVCQRGAVQMFRLIQKKIAAGARKVELGHIAAQMEERGRGMVEFVDETSPCAAEVITVPADRALPVAREVLKGLSSVPVQPR